jgi:hypothetical protein
MLVLEARVRFFSSLLVVRPLKRFKSLESSKGLEIVRWLGSQSR